MEKKEFLTEEAYLSGKKKLIRIALIILIAGVLLGGSLIVTGIVKTNSAKKANEESAVIQQAQQQAQQQAAKEEAQKKLKENETKKAEIQTNIDSIQTQIDTLDLEIQKLRNEKSQIFMQEGNSDSYNAKDTEIMTKEQEKAKLTTQLREYKSQLSEIEQDDFLQNSIISTEDFFGDVNSQFSGIFDTIFTESTNTISTAKYVPLYFIGGFIILASCGASLVIYLIAKRREIKVFTTQQTMPVNQEIIDKMAPTVGNAVGTIGKDLAKGITSGIKEGSKENQE